MFGGVRLCSIVVCISGICIPYCANAASVTFTENFPINITRYRRQTNCRVDQFRCGSQECIAEENECDGKEDCRDGSDETENCMKSDCPYFRCAYGACIDKHLECNGEKNCKDNSDEMTPNCTKKKNCRVDQFRCDSQECIAEENECDGKEDCRDGSDETENCMKSDCPYFRCAYGACIDKHLECNGEKNCKDNSDEMTPNCTKKKNCRIDEFQCKSGQCIKEKQQCDGKADCDDNSDENEDCLEMPCLDFTYTCKYGGCVSQNARCNGISECFDGSDEKDCPEGIEPRVPLTTTPITATPLSTTDCLIPENPPHGKFNIGDGTMSLYKPGTYIPHLSVIRLQCEGGFEIEPRQSETHYYCSNGQWSPSLATCTRARTAGSCEPLTSTMSTKVKCTHPKEQGDSCEDPYDGTTATFECEPFYENPYSTISPTSKCKNGRWNSRAIECVPICGQKRPKGQTNIIGGKITKKSDYPWHVGIYRTSDRSQICGGSILTMRVILSAAHCFDTSANTRNGADYLIAAGKHYRTYDDDGDEEVQYSKIQEFHTPERYIGEKNQFAADIVVVILQTPLNLSISVQPVCVDWNDSFEREQLSENNLGIVAGWGSTIEGKPSEELKELNVPYIPYAQCQKRVPDGFIKYITNDKICGGYFNEGTSVCGGDSGGGLVFRHDNDKYYIRGVVSTSPSNEERACDSNSYATYTLVSEYLDFIKELEIGNRP